MKLKIIKLLESCFRRHSGKNFFLLRTKKVFSLGRSAANKTNAGFTLIETLVTLALFIIITFAFIGLYLQFSRLFSLNAAHFTSLRSARTAITAIGKDITGAARVVANHTFGNTAYVTSANTLVLRLPGINANGNTLDGVYDYVGFYLTNSTLNRVVDGTPPSMRLDGTAFVAAPVNGLTFSFDTSPADNAAAVGVATTAQDAEAQAKARVSEFATFTLRNY